MKILSYNVNGLRAALRKGLGEWLQQNPMDVVCLQEAKARQEDVDTELFRALGFTDHWFCAQKKGYSGVTVLTRTEPDQVICGTGHAMSDEEGRVIQLQFGSVRIIDAYFPAGTSGEIRQTYKYQWLDEFRSYLDELQRNQPRMILCGDYNIAHREVDLHDPVRNKKNSGFLPEERAWMDRLYDEEWVDAFRTMHPERKGGYTWWSQRFPSVRKENKGWRLDYISITRPLLPFLKGADIFPDAVHSDHCPVFAEVDVAAANSGSL